MASPERATPARKAAAKRTPKAKTPAKPAAAADAAAREAADERATADFHGLSLSLPASLPNSFALRLGKLQYIPGAGRAAAVYGLLVSILKEDQLDAVMDKLDELPGEMDDILGDLMVTITAAYGGEPGE